MSGTDERRKGPILEMIYDLVKSVTLCPCGVVKRSNTVETGSRKHKIDCKMCNKHFEA